MDWGLMTFHRDGSITFRTQKYYLNAFYFFACIINFILRFSWLINRVPFFQHYHSSVIILIIEIGEVFRRCLWALIRIEWEVVNIDRKLDDKEKALSPNIKI